MAARTVTKCDRKEGKVITLFQKIVVLITYLGAICSNLKLHDTGNYADTKMKRCLANDTPKYLSQLPPQQYSHA